MSGDEERIIDEYASEAMPAPRSGPVEALR
jgi:hypothetical protein